MMKTDYCLYLDLTLNLLFDRTTELATVLIFVLRITKNYDRVKKKLPWLETGGHYNRHQRLMVSC